MLHFSWLLLFGCVPIQAIEWKY